MQVRPDLLIRDQRIGWRLPKRRWAEYWQVCYCCLSSCSLLKSVVDSHQGINQLAIGLLVYVTFLHLAIKRFQRLCGL